MIRMILGLMAAMMMLSGCHMMKNWEDKHAAKMLVHDAIEAIERDGSAVLADFRDPPWRDGELYLSVLSHDGVLLFHAINPENEGKNRWDLTDVNGVKLTQNIIAIADEHGHGWTKYHWRNPVSDAVEAKRTYVSSAMMDGRKIIVSAGYYVKG